jgi:hypothetical protein
MNRDDETIKLLEALLKREPELRFQTALRRALAELTRKRRAQR